MTEPRLAEWAIRLSPDAEVAYQHLADESRARVDKVLWTLGLWLDRCADRVHDLGSSKLYRHSVPFVEITYTPKQDTRELEVLHVVDPMQPRITVFVSYSHKDRKFKEVFRGFMINLERTGRVHFWDDDKIQTGADWKVVIFEAMANARIAVLLVTQNFIKSDFINDHELPVLVARNERKELQLFWIPVEPATLTGTLLEPLQPMTDRNWPLSRRNKPERDHQLVQIYERLFEECLKS